MNKKTTKLFGFAATLLPQRQIPTLQFRLNQVAKRAGLSVSSARFIAQFGLCCWSLTELLQLAKAEIFTRRRRRFSIYLPRLFYRKTC